jgi:hypothetical protein
MSKSAAFFLAGAFFLAVARFLGARFLAGAFGWMSALVFLVAGLSSSGEGVAGVGRLLDGLVGEASGSSSDDSESKGAGSSPFKYASIISFVCI